MHFVNYKSLNMIRANCGKEMATKTKLRTRNIILKNLRDVDECEMLVLKKRNNRSFRIIAEKIL
jgi:hypothetical protein